MKTAYRNRRTASVRTAYALVVVLSLFWATSALAVELRAQVDRRSMAANETLNLEVVYEGSVSTNVIDFEALLSDFKILGIRPSSETRFENFKRSSRTSWQLTLLPKRVGVLEIPSIQIKGERTHAIRIRVGEAPDSPELGAPLSARLVSDRREAFVDEQILIRIQISASQDINGLRGSAFDVTGADVSLLEQREYQRVVRGEPYKITELVYAVFAKAPGTIEIPVFEYTGRFRRGRTVIARTRAEKFEIRDPADDAIASSKSPWLPVSGLAMASEWSSPPDSLRVGEPVTRTIRVASASQRAAAIPPIELSEGPYKLYPEQPALKDTETSTGLLGSRVDAFVLVPTEAGTHTLPALEIDWWNIGEKRWEKARIPSETITVGAATGMAAVPVSPGTAPNPDGPSPEPTGPSAGASVGSASALELVSQSRSIQVLVGGLSMLCLILAVACISLARRVRTLEGSAFSPDERVRSSRFESEATAMKSVRRAIAARDAAGLRQHLLRWARVRFDESDLGGLDAVGSLAGDAEFARILSALDASLYARDGAFTDWGPLEDRLTWLASQKPAANWKRASSLPPLYPSEAQDSPQGASR